MEERKESYVLETPDDLESIYLARGEEVEQLRPMFTGDIYRLADGALRMVLQHPCALRRGPLLHPKLLVAAVYKETGLRSKWDKFAYSKMPLPKLTNAEHYAADFDDLDLSESAVLLSSNRIANLSLPGANLLMQRWTHHNTRLVVPTQRYAEVVIGPYDEADLLESWILDRVDDGIDATSAEQECSDWLEVEVNGHKRRNLLAHTQHASGVRREATLYRKANKFPG